MTQPNLQAHMDATDLMQARKSLRQSLLLQRKTIAPVLRAGWDAQLMQNLVHWCTQERAHSLIRSLAVYWPIQGEPDLRAAYPQLSEMGIQLALPWVSGKQMPLRFLAWQDGDDMVSDEFGIPLPAQREHLVIPDVILVPCVGFNQAGYRLGYGGGFYDRTLAIMPEAIPVGIAYQCASTDFLPGRHDIPMRLILTEAQGNLD